MCYIFGVCLILFIFLFVASCKLVLPWESAGVNKIFEKMGDFIFRIPFLTPLFLKTESQIIIDLERFYPGESRNLIYERYVAQKLAKGMELIAVGCFLGMVVFYQASQERLLIEGHSLKRGNYGGSDQSVMLSMVTEEGEEIVEVTVGPQEYSADELEALRGDFRDKLEKKVLGDNRDLGNVFSDLDLVDQISDYPFDIEWSISNYDVIGLDGCVSEVSEITEVLLIAGISYIDEEWEEEFCVCVVPKAFSEEEQKKIRIGKMLDEANQDNPDESLMVLPKEYEGKAITWSKVVDDYSIVVWLVFLMVAILIYFFTDKDIHSKTEERKTTLLRAYPEIIQKMVLYMGAGMTVRGAFLKIAECGKKEPIYEEMIYTCRALQSGTSEYFAYEQFGRRTDLQEYIRLCTLLQQNLKKGSSSLLPRLREEAEIASRQRIQNCRQKGEEAVTKLLLPMMLMLMIVMIMIMWPAFSSMGF